MLNVSIARMKPVTPAGSLKMVCRYNKTRLYCEGFPS